MPINGRIFLFVVLFFLTVGLFWALMKTLNISEKVQTVTILLILMGAGIVSMIPLLR